MSHYRRLLIEAASALVAEGDLEMRLTHVAGYLLQIDDEEIPPGALRSFERVRDPLIARPMVSPGEMIPRDISQRDAKTAALGVLNLLITEMGGQMTGHGYLRHRDGPEMAN